MISWRWASSVTDVRVYRGANCDSDHYLVGAKIKQRVANVSKGKSESTKKWATEKLKRQETQQMYEESIESKISNEGPCDNIEEHWEFIKNTVTAVAAEVIGEKKRQRNEGWYDNECRQAVGRKN